MSDTLWTPREVASYLQVSRDWVYRRAASGELPCIRLGGHVRFSPAKVRAWAEGHTHEARVVPIRQHR